MSRRKKLPHGRKKSINLLPTESQRTQKLIEDTLSTFTCSTQIAHDFLHQCVDELESLDCQLDYNQLAVQMWRSGPGQTSDLVSILSDYLALRDRNRAALTLIHQRLSELLATPYDHHLDPSQWRDAVTQRVLLVPPAP